MNGKGEEMKVEGMSLEELLDELRINIRIHETNNSDTSQKKADDCENQILNRFNNLTDKVKELENEAEVTNDDLYVSFMTYYELNRWTPESGFEKPIDFYIHEIWKRNPRVAALEAENAALKSQVEGLKRKSQANGFDLDGNPICYKIT